MVPSYSNNLILFFCQVVSDPKMKFLLDLKRLTTTFFWAISENELASETKSSPQTRSVLVDRSLIRSDDVHSTKYFFLSRLIQTLPKPYLLCFSTIPDFYEGFWRQSRGSFSKFATFKQTSTLKADSLSTSTIFYKFPLPLKHFYDRLR